MGRGATTTSGNNRPMCVTWICRPVGVPFNWGHLEISSGIVPCRPESVVVVAGTTTNHSQLPFTIRPSKVLLPPSPPTGESLLYLIAQTQYRVSRSNSTVQMYSTI
eukprot:8368386-Pyramimonas_sp.AAC.1